MFALPIIERELRVRARKPWTVWTRVVVGLIISLLAIESLNSASGWGASAGRQGKALFDTLSALLFVLCLVEGVRQTADSLSKEKREGTLGLLFLTRLTGFDVVLGKLVATSLSSFYMLLAAFPAMALALPAGGLTVGEFWRTQLVLLNALFLSVAAGMWASARHSQEYRTLAGGLGLVCALAVLPWMVEWLLRRLGLPNVSPWVALALADDADYRLNARHFWLTLAATHGLAWALLVNAGRRVQVGWREEPEPVSTSAPASVPAISLPLRPPRAWRLSMTASPAAWLANRLPTYRGLIWFAIVALALSVGARRSGMLHWGMVLIPSLMLSFIATRSFAEARRSGAMELLLSTPLSATAIVEAHWRALWRQMLFPFWLVAGLFAYSTSMELVLRSVNSGWWSAEASNVVSRLLPVADCLLRAIAVCWVGLYLGLRMGSTPQAIGNCLFWTVGVPAVGTMLLEYIFSQLSSPAFLPAGLLVTGPWQPSGLELISNGLNAAYSLYLVAWAQGRLRTRFRELAAGD